MNLSTRTKSLGFALLLVLSLGAVQPTSAVEASLDGPGEVSQTNTARFTANVGVSSPGARIDSLTLTFRPVGGEESVTVTLAPDGTVRQVDPADGTVGQGEIRVALLRRTLDVDVVDDPGGYGYGYGAGNATYDVRVDTRAFKQGAYDVTLTVECDGGASSSDATRFEVTLPSADDGGDESADDARSIRASGAPVRSTEGA